MNRLKLPSLWTAFAAFGLFTIMLSSALQLSILYFLKYVGIIDELKHRSFIPLLITLIFSITIASTISYFIGKHVFRPINAINSAMIDVAKGDFNIKLQYNGSVKELEEISKSFNIMVHELGNIEALRNDFVVMISHEFKTPLAAIEGYTAILKNPELTEKESREYLQKINESVNQLVNLSTSILMISNLENKEMITEKKQFRLDEQIRQAVLLLEPLWENKKLSLDIELDPVVYFTNDELLMQVWINLISNAIKFTPRNGEVGILLKETKHGVEITVSDTGIGMTADVQKHIFNKFYKTDRTGYTDGNGLGLALVKRIVELCHGTITVQSAPDFGSSFTVTLPVSE